jgi:hypothetical protein
MNSATYAAFSVAFILVIGVLGAMTDRELLELAAKAIGMKLQYNYLGGRDANQPWDPLADDGDALRLAVKLRIEIGFAASRAWAVQPYKDVRTHEEATMGYGIEGATRRAIVLAAAEIGKAMP